MTENTEIVVTEQIRLGTLAVATPAAVIHAAGEIAKQLTDIVERRKLFSNISGRKFVRVEGWSTMGAMMGILPRERSVIEHDNGDFEAVVDLIRASDGAIIGSGSAIVGADEPTWNKRPRYARRSMALTRATGKAFRLGFSWIVTLAGYEATPAEEMDGVIDAQFVDEKPAQPAAPAKVVEYPAELTVVTNSEGIPYVSLPTDKLSVMANSIRKASNKPDLSEDDKARYAMKLDTIKQILAIRNGG